MKDKMGKKVLIMYEAQDHVERHVAQSRYQ